MRLNVDNIDPKIIGLIYEDKARHNHSTLADTLACLIKRAMEIVDDSTIDNLHPLARSLVPIEDCEEIKG
jgi:hypothetical protein